MKEPDNTMDAVPAKGTKDILKECRTCSRTFATILNRQFGHPRVPEEKAMNLMAGGILNQGYQCGMLRVYLQKGDIPGFWEKSINYRVFNPLPSFVSVPQNAL